MNMAHGQASKLDSLHEVLRMTHHPEKRAEVLHELSDALHSTQPQQALKHAQEALQIAEKANSEKWKAYA